MVTPIILIRCTKCNWHRKNAVGYDARPFEPFLKWFGKLTFGLVNQKDKGFRPSVASRGQACITRLALTLPRTKIIARIPPTGAPSLNPSAGSRRPGTQRDHFSGVTQSDVTALPNEIAEAPQRICANSQKPVPPKTSLLIVFATILRSSQSEKFCT